MHSNSTYINADISLHWQMMWFAEVPQCLSTVVLQLGNSLHSAVPLHPLDAERAVLIGNTLYETSLIICSVAVGKTHGCPKHPAHSGERVVQLTQNRTERCNGWISELKRIHLICRSLNHSTIVLVSLTDSSSISRSLPRDIHPFGFGGFLTSSSNTTSFWGSGGCTKDKYI